MIYKKELNDVCGFIIKHHQTISIAESVTSGLLQNVFSNVKEASFFFAGGITAYNLQQKCTHLFIDPAHAVTCNCVSEKVAEQMALGVSKSFKTNWGMAITGYASPLPEIGVNELYACYAICLDQKILKRSTVKAVTEEPEEVQHFYAMSLIEDFMLLCTENKVLQP